MKPSFLALASLIPLGLAFGVMAQDVKPATPAAAAAVLPGALKDPKALNGYAIGLNIGASVKRDGVELDPEMFARGFRDGFTGAKPLISPDQARAALSQLKASMQAQRQVVTAKAAEANKAQGEAFLKANAAKPGVVSLPSGLQYQVLKAGTGPTPKLTDTVSCNYRGTLIDGAEFDSSYARGTPTSFPVGGVIKGWTEALQKMPVGAKWRLFVPSDLAYGEKGAGEAIGPNATLIFEVELLAIEPAGK